MSAPHFSAQSTGQQEPLQFEDILSYYSATLQHMHNELANLHAMIRNRDRAIEALRNQMAEVIGENNDLKTQRQEA